MRLVRGLWPGMAARVAARYHADMEAKWLASGTPVTPVGAWGAADSAAAAEAGAAAGAGAER
jgi:hypothetical protein